MNKLRIEGGHIRKNKMRNPVKTVYSSDIYSLQEIKQVIENINNPLKFTKSAGKCEFINTGHCVRQNGPQSV